MGAGIAAGLTIALAVAAMAAAVGAGVVKLPDAACNAGTATAHASIPAETGDGTPTPGQSHVPVSSADGCTTGTASG